MWNKKVRGIALKWPCVKARDSARGFTLVEMFVVISIFAVMASIVIYKFQDFNKDITLDNLAQDIALRISEAQKTAISGVLASGGGTGLTPPSYGVHFSSDPTAGSNKQFIYFTDTYPPASGITPAGNSLYDGIAAGISSLCGSTYGAECLSVTSITTGDYISDLCTPVGTTASCTTAGTADVTFVRPFPDAHMRASWTGTSCTTTDCSKLYIELTSGSDATLMETIVVSNLGEVHVFNGSVHAACAADGITC